MTLEGAHMEALNPVHRPMQVITSKKDLPSAAEWRICAGGGVEWEHREPAAPRRVACDSCYSVSLWNSV